MAAEPIPGPGLVATFHHWWKESSAHEGFFSTLTRFIAALWEFARESTPSRRRRRYGDVEYDWDYRGDTTSATVGWRDRLLGLFHSPYQPTEPALFREMLASLMLASPMLSSAKIDFCEFTFIDIGSGKGRALLMAADYPFRRILGIELLPELHRVAQENISKYKSDSQQCFDIDCLQGDACEFAFPAEPTVLYLFNPLPESGLVTMISNLEHSLREHPRPVFVVSQSAAGTRADAEHGLQENRRHASVFNLCLKKCGVVGVPPPPWSFGMKELRPDHHQNL